MIFNYMKKTKRVLFMLERQTGMSVSFKMPGNLSIFSEEKVVFVGSKKKTYLICSLTPDPRSCPV